MIRTVISMTLALVSVATSSALAADLTERVMTERMTIVKVDRAQGRFLCAEHRHWTWISKQDVALIGAGDIVTVQRQPRGLPRVKVVRAAAEELTSPEW
jgi:hypothetical protein